METKTCTLCKIEKPKTKEFFYIHKHNKGFRSYCIECTKNNNMTKGREKQLRRRYGINIDQYNQILEKQNHSCAICKKHANTFNNNFHVDHCHKTAIVRGLLCYNCNMAIGRFQDSIEYLKNAIVYLSAVK